MVATVTHWTDPPEQLVRPVWVITRPWRVGTVVRYTQLVAPEAQICWGNLALAVGTPLHVVEVYDA